jgi:exodeoxyribonuclease VII small subunit
MTESTTQPEDLPFEEALERLDQIVAGMEGGQLSLDEMVNHFEEGAALLRHCRSRLDHARHRVERITAELEATGKATLTPFHPEDDAACVDGQDSPKPARAKRGKTDKSTDDIRLL